MLKFNTLYKFFFDDPSTAINAGNFVFLLFFSCSMSLFSQSNNSDYVVDYITTKQGLSHNYVSSIVSDELNLKWIGTENGITKFNGFEFEYIKPSEDYKELLNENIEVLFMDKSSNLWIGTKSGGLSYIDTEHNEVKNFNHLIDLEGEGDLRVTAISEDKNGHIWIGTWQDGVFVIDFNSDKLIQHFEYNQPIYFVKSDFKGNVWFSDGSKVLMFEIESEEITAFPLPGQVCDLLSDMKRQKIWIAVAGKNTKLYSFDYKSQVISEIETGVESSFAKKLSLDKYQRIWIGTWRNGLYRSNEDLSDFKKIDLINRNNYQAKGNYNTILDVHHDKNNVVWLATANGGVVRLLENNGFDNASNLISNISLKENLNCNAIYKEKDHLFVGTYSGLFIGTKFDNVQKIEALGDVKVNSFYENNQKLYIGTAQGFHIYDLALKKFVFTNFEYRKVTSFLIDNETLYFGTQESGLVVVKLSDIENQAAYQSFSDRKLSPNHLKNSRITSIKKDINNHIWVSTYNGLHLLDRKNNTFIHQSALLKGKLPSAIINGMILRDSFIWLATPNGLIQMGFDGKALKIQKMLTQKNGLNSDFICAVAFDSGSNLWFSTHTEIVKFNSKTNAIYSYGYVNGVASTSFNNNSSYKGSDGTIYFGGVDNLTYFKPNDIKPIRSKPNVVFTNLRVNNEIITFKDGHKILDKSVNYADKIKLSHKEKFFSTSFVANDFLGNLNIKYRYKLEGYQNQWIDLQNRNEINFAGLPAGNYVLKVIASRDNQNWSQPKSIKIVLSESPWLSIWAISLYALIVLSVVVYLIRSKNYKVKLKNNLEIARIEKQKETELTEAKLNFFTNISHEFRTPLTLIISPLKELLESTNLTQKAYKNLHFIDKNTNRLLNLINQLLDFRKADHGLLKLDVSLGNFVRFSNEVHLYFQETAKAKDIKYKFKPAKEDIQVPFDRNKMEIVLCNILSNALKYTNSGGKIVMKVDSDDQYCTISIKDNGIGMKEEDLEKIFDRFFQIKSANSARLVGSGIGLFFSKKIIDLHYGDITVLSKINEGTEFIIKLSLDPQLYGAEINHDFIKTDNIKGYNIENFSKNIETLNLKAKEFTILIIDDNADILDYLNDILSEDYHVIQANNGEMGFEKASSEIPNLIISDVMMPGKDGLTLCKELKSQITTSHIPILLLTARTSTVFEIEGLKTGADDYITKPFNANVIKARIASLLENREKLRAHLLNKVRFEPTMQELDVDADTENVFINNAILLVEKNLDNPAFGIETMISELHMSQSTLFRKIKSLTGLSLTAFIRSVRLKRAAYLIATTDLNMNQIAYEVGFNDYKYFKTSFKKQFDCLPTQYKEQITK